MMTKTLLALLCLTTALMSQERPPILIAEIDGNEVPMLLTKVESEVKIAGRLAETSLTMTFFNKNKRQLSGTLYFPLPEEATVSGYGLDINGKMIDGVIVNKAEGRRIFEKIVRQNTDPGLIEWTRGNTFKTRVFPIPPEGQRVIKVVYVTELNAIDNTFKLPMNYKEPIESFKLNISVLNPYVSPKLHGAEFKQDHGIWKTELEYKNKALTEAIVVEIPELSSRKTFVEKASDGNYYYVIYDTPEAQKPLKGNIKAVTVVWDFSLSRNAKHEKEIDLLRTYLNTLPASTKINLAGFSNTAKNMGRFTASQVDNIISVIEKEKYDGGTHFNSLQNLLSSVKSDVILLFSDGIANWGNRKLELKTPVYTFSADASTEAAYLKYISLSSGGQWFNLKKLSVSEVANAIGKKVYMYQGAEGGIAGTAYPKIPQPVNGTVIITGKLEGNRGKVKLSYGFPGDKRKTSVYDINTNNAFGADLLRRYWAQRKLANLLLDKEENKEKIETLGKKHHLVTPYTSLIVLEDIAQYLEHEVRPPESMPEWVKTYDKRMAEIAAQKDQTEQDQIKNISSIWDSRIQHFNKEFKYPDNFKYKGSKKEKDGESADRLSGGAPAAPIVNNYNIERGLVGVSEEAALEIQSKRVSFDDSGRYNLTLSTVDASKPHAGGPSTAASIIAIKKWDPKTPYISALKKAKDQYAAYIEQRKKNINSPAFYFDCAAFFYNAGKMDLGEKILSNIIELDLENAALMRIIAYRLIEEKSYDLAVKILRDVVKIRQEEPQSYRDLALALAAKADSLGNKNAQDAKSLYQEALNNLEKVIKSKWDRFNEIEVIALNEYNRICRKSGLSHFNKELGKVLNDDIRIILSWDADQTDIDLWVTEPSGEKVDYSHNRSAIGGRMSRDFTNGYGPEEYTVKKAMNGKYKIQANFFGSNQVAVTGGVTLKVDVYTRYGTPEEKHQTFSVKVKDKKEVIDLGEIEFK